MQSRIPLPTDNVYKFYAMFGLLILLTTGIMFFIRHEYYNSMAFERLVPIETLKAKNKPTAAEKLELYLLEQKAEIAKLNKEFELGIYSSCFLIFGLGFTSSGFYYWHTKIQPMQDKLLELQVKKAEYEVRALHQQLQRTRFTRS
ncbi:hypothetical protein [Rheinheimera sp. 1928-s]|uniref:hypothetical protein n=1 Tax=Rheinheimera sp. 1928-s TaxID=3033803 RepID=UPI00262DE227|nr:hypothetical protein [Rheinheimera sp. 1928-s]MDF3125561.1 hypothetical protein [Rheinheimera sp. 1928-s]